MRMEYFLFDNYYEAFFFLGATACKRKMLECEEVEGKKFRLSKNLFLDDLLRTNFAVVDTETTGFSSRDVAIQTCVLLCDADGKEIYKYDEYWKTPQDVTINPRASAVHKISEDKLEEAGLDARTEIQWVHALLNQLASMSAKIIAHNAKFDARILRQTASSTDAEWRFDSFFCTQAASRHLVSAKDKNGKVKAPSNKELYEHVTNTKICESKLHDAYEDCKITAASYVIGKKLQWW